MKVLKAIGGFFAKIGRWIRDTAWVQPLLIVGGIFAIIFSIPYIVDAVEANFDAGDEASQYYSKYQLSLEGASEKKSEADELFQYIYKKVEDNNVTNEKFGDKFFLTLVSDSCAGCKEIYPGFQTFESKVNDGSFDIGGDFKFFTIDINQSTDDKVEGSQTTFSKHFYNNINDNYSFFDNATTIIMDRPYYTNQGGENSENYGKLLLNISNLSEFPTPATFFFDFTFSESVDGLAEVLFNFEGKDGDSSSYGLARTLLDCWNHEGEFGEIQTN